MLDVHFPTTDRRTLILSHYAELNADQKTPRKKTETRPTFTTTTTDYPAAQVTRPPTHVAKTFGGPLKLHAFFLQLRKFG